MHYSFIGGSWINLNEGGRGWEVVVKGQLTPRSDNGFINSSPVSATTPIVRLQYGCNRVTNIPGTQIMFQSLYNCSAACFQRCNV